MIGLRYDYDPTTTYRRTVTEESEEALPFENFLPAPIPSTDCRRHPVFFRVLLFFGLITFPVFYSLIFRSVLL